MMEGSILVYIKIKTITLATVLSLSGSINVFAVEPTELSETKLDTISESCDGAIKSLKALQKSDTRVRTSIGPVYDKLQNKFIVPLNVRLVSNNFSIPDLITIQAKFATKKTNFYKDFTKYSQHLEDLIAIGCKTSPSDFYKQLEIVREKRKIVHEDVEELNEISNDYKIKLSSLEIEL